MKQTAPPNETQGQLEAEGKTLFTEGQNAFTLRGRSAALEGKPDLITVSGDRGLIVDKKTVSPWPLFVSSWMLCLRGCLKRAT